MRSFAVLKPGGRAAFIGSGAEGAGVAARRRAVAAPQGRPRPRRISSASPHLLATGAVRVPEIKVFPLREAAAAHRISEGRHFRGKLVLTMR